MSSFDDLEYDQANLLTDSAMSELQLRHQPFSTTSDAGEWFVDEITESQIEDIRLALVSGDDLLLVLGPEGAGKSTLLAQLAADSAPRIQCFTVLGSERFSTDNLFAGMLEAFKTTPASDLKLMLDQVIPGLQGMMEHNTLCTVVLDQAHLVKEPELTKLLSAMLYINSTDETLLRIMLAAPTEFEEHIPDLLPEGADLPYSSLAIEAFDKTRTRNYLEYRLLQAGAVGDFPFDDAEIAEMNDAAVGRPGALHALAAETLNVRDDNYVPALPPELAASSGAAARRFGGGKLLLGLLALGLIFGGLFLSRSDNGTSSNDRYTVVENKKINTDDNAEQIRLLAEEKKALENAAREKLAANSSTAANNTGSSNNTGSNATTAAGNTSDEQALKDAELARQKLAEARARATADAQASAEAEKAKADEAAKAQAAANEKRLADQRAAEQNAAEQAKAAALKAEEDAKKQSLVDATSSPLESASWILVQDAKLFTVQMSASTDRQVVRDFLARNQLEPPNSIFTFNRDGTTWYALVNGLYPSIESARKEIEKLPPAARSNQPWIRSIGRVQKALREQN